MLKTAGSLGCSERLVGMCVSRAAGKSPWCHLTAVVSGIDFSRIWLRRKNLCIPGTGWVFLGKGWISQGMFLRELGETRIQGSQPVNIVVQGEKLLIRRCFFHGEDHVFVLQCVSGGDFCPAWVSFSLTRVQRTGWGSRAVWSCCGSAGSSSCCRFVGLTVWGEFTASHLLRYRSWRAFSPDSW